MTVAELLSRNGLRLLLCDPYITALPAPLRDSRATLVTAGIALATADIAAILVPHRCFAALPGAAAPGVPWRLPRPQTPPDPSPARGGG